MHPEVSKEELANAIHQQRISLLYQPLVNIHAANHIVGFEALVRLKSAQGIDISAETIIRLSEQYQLISALTQTVIALSLSEYVQLLTRFPDAYLAINLSASDIDESMIEYLWKTMRTHHITHSQVMIELTERVVMNQQANRSIKTLQTAGHRLSIDDFGSGASNVRYLQELTPDIVKIDKAFVDWSEVQGPVSTLLSQLITIGKTLHAKIVVEGVETKTQADKILASGAHYGQGYYWYPPLSVSDLLSLR